MRTALLALAAIASLTLASSSFATVQMNGVQIHSSLHLVASSKHQTAGNQTGSFKANGGRVKNTFPSGCTYGANDITRCTQICIASASGNMCAEEVACYHNDRKVPCN